MAIVALEAAPGPTREGRGPQASRGGRVPGVHYGRGEDSIALTVALKDLHSVLIPADAATSSWISSSRRGRKDMKALIREIQRDPVAGVILHLDLQAHLADRAHTVEVPIVLIGVPTGVKDGPGGQSSSICSASGGGVSPDRHPAKLEIDVEQPRDRDSLHVGDLKVERAEILNGSRPRHRGGGAADDPRGGRACGRGCRGEPE